MRKRLLLIGGGLVALAALVAGGGYIAYKAGLFRSTKTERGQTLGVNEASTPQAAPRARAQPSWPVFRYDAFRTGFNPGAHARPPFSVVWKRGLYRDGYMEAPAVTADGVIVYASYGKSFGSDLFAADALKGRLLWHKHFRHPANFAGSPGIGGGRAYITSHDGNIRVYDLRTGRLAWRMKIAAAESPPIVAGNLVYFGDGPSGGGDGHFRAVDVRTHRVVWSYRAAGNISSGAALTRTTAYFSSYGGSVYALDRFRGDSRFTTWAYRFVLLEAAVKVRRRAWQGHEVTIDGDAWARMAAHGRSADDELETGELLAAIAEAVPRCLSEHQRRVLTALALPGCLITGAG